MNLNGENNLYTNRRMESTTETMVAPTNADIKLPKMCKEIRYYYRHREELAEKRRQRLLQDPDYQAKQLEKEEKKRAKEEEKQRAKEEAKRVKEEEKEAKRLEKLKEKEQAKEAKRKKKAELLGILPSLCPV